jgi:hypothetical protein
MEKQKIFWVILSVTVFVVVVLVVGLFLLKQNPDGLAVSPAATAPVATVKPEGTPAGIYEFGRDASSAEGDLVYVPFAGSGSELEACERLGRRWVASDTDPQCVRMAQERIDRSSERRGGNECTG